MPGDVVIDCDDNIITAGLINTHHHLYQWMTRGRAIGCDLFGWLTELYPVWGELDVEDVSAAATVGLGELALTGCTTAFDHHYLVPRGDDTVFDAIVEAARAVGVRLHLSRGSMDLGESRGGLPPDHVVEDIDAILASTERIIAEHHDGVDVSVVVAPCNPFSVSEQLMVDSAALARRHGLRLHTHLAETVDEEHHCLERFGRRPLEVLDDWGWIAPDVWVAHGIWFDDAEIARLGNVLRRGALPVVERPTRRRHLSGDRSGGGRGAGRPRSGWRGVERGRWPVPRAPPIALRSSSASARSWSVPTGGRTCAGYFRRCPMPRSG